MRSLRWVATPLILLALGLTGCSGGGTDRGQADDARDVSLDDVMSQVPSTLRVTVDGTITFSFEGNVDLLTTLINNPEATPLRFLSVGMERMRTLDDGTAFRVAFDFPGEFDGAGSYELAAVGGARTTAPSVDPTEIDPNEAVSGLSRAFVVFNAEGNADDDPALVASQESFDIITEPCRLEVEDDRGEAGSLVCPELAHADGRTVSLEMEWEKR